MTISSDSVILLDRSWSMHEERTWIGDTRSRLDWAKAGVFERMFNALSDEPDMEVAMVDGTIVKFHRHGMGSKGGLSVRR